MIMKTFNTIKLASNCRKNQFLPLWAGIQFCVMLLAGSVLVSQAQNNKPGDMLQKAIEKEGAFLIVLGTVQDAGSPHIACKKICCAELYNTNDFRRKVVSLGLLDTRNKKKYLLEATPDMTHQMKTLRRFAHIDSKETPDGIFLTHAHIGHYTGLMYLGKEAVNADKVKVYAMPKMKHFLEQNGPWSQLVSNQNILIHEMTNQKAVLLTPSLKVIPILVPHRDEYSETVGYMIQGPEKSALFIPDIDKWEKWNLDITEEIKKVDYAFLDATFFDGKEINNRDISQIPHPFIVESMKKFEGMHIEERHKIIFIHFNHTNPVLNPESAESKTVEENGFRIARRNDVFQL